MLKSYIYEILKNCPIGKLLWADGYGTVQFMGIEDNNVYPIKLSAKIDGKIQFIYCTKYGQFIDAEDASTAVHPIGQIDWGFWQHSLFAPGDIVIDNHAKVICISSVCKGKLDGTNVFGVSECKLNEEDFVFADATTKGNFIKEIEKEGKLVYRQGIGILPVPSTQLSSDDSDIEEHTYKIGRTNKEISESKKIIQSLFCENDKIDKSNDNSSSSQLVKDIAKSYEDPLDESVSFDKKVAESYEEIVKKENKPVFDEFKEGGRFTKSNCRDILELFKRVGCDVPEEKLAVDPPYSHYRKWDDMVIQVNKPGIMMVITAIEEKLNNKDSTNVGKIAEIKEVVNYFKNQING